MRAYTGNFGMFVRAYTYIRSNGGDGLREVSNDAVLAANYLRVRLADAFDLPYDRICKHEVVFSAAAPEAAAWVTTLDIAKAILDHRIHPPTIYFPLIVEEALMIEPTETESLETLDHSSRSCTASPSRPKRRRKSSSGRRSPPRSVAGRGNRRGADRGAEAAAVRAVPNDLTAARVRNGKRRA